MIRGGQGEVRVGAQRFARRRRRDYRAGRMAGDAKSRLRWHLRAEQAFGLKSVPVGRADAGDEVSPSVCADESDRPAAPEPVATVVRPTQAKSPKSGELFAPDADLPGFDAPPLSPDDKRARLIALDDKEVR